MEKNNFGRELENVTNLFISSNGESRAFQPGVEKAQDETSVPEPEPMDVNIEETVRVKRKMAFHGSQDVQRNMTHTLFKYLQENYIITMVELRKASDIFEQGKKTTREEEIVLYREQDDGGI